jgi:hypothetical protein
MGMVDQDFGQIGIDLFQPALGRGRLQTEHVRKGVGCGIGLSLSYTDRRRENPAVTTSEATSKSKPLPPFTALSKIEAGI